MGLITTRKFKLIYEKRTNLWNGIRLPKEWAKKLNINEYSNSSHEIEGTYIDELGFMVFKDKMKEIDLELLQKVLVFLADSRLKLHEFQYFIESNRESYYKKK
jgi:hypothetical protein